jgi:N-acetylneuraminic acid mutarotase
MKEIYFLFLLFILTFSISAQCSFTTNITASGPTLSCGNVTLSAGSTGNVWTQKANFGGTIRFGAVGFSIGTSGYFGSGINGSTYFNDFWEYNPSNNTWTQKANIAGGARSWAVGFGIGSKGYLGTGYNGSALLDDFWEYDPGANTWTQKANFGGGLRQFACGFSLNTKGYIGTGNNSSTVLDDFWEYNPITNIWTQKANFGGGVRRNAVGLSIGAYGYIGTGHTGSYALNDFWQFDPGSNIWIQKSSIGSIPFLGAVSFVMNGIGYIATGLEFPSSTTSDKLWEYNPLVNNWIQKTSLGSSNGRAYGSGFAVGLKGYIGTGNYNGTNLNSFWEYDGPGMYAWSNGANSQTMSTSLTGNYSVIVTNGSGCTATATQSLAISPSPTITISGANAACAGISNTVVANGATTYTWSASAGGGNSNSVILTPTIYTTYTLAGTTGSCQSSSFFTLNVFAVPIVTIAASGATLGCGNATLTANPGGNNWIQKASLSVNRRGSVAFSIGNKGYFGTGEDPYNSPNYFVDFWEYDPITNAWTQKANFGGGGRANAVGFCIGSKGYIGTGYNANTSPYYYSDFWEYDPGSNTWTQKANFAGGLRNAATGFAIGNKGYLGTGEYGSHKNDFWEFNPSNNTWTQRATFIGGLRYGSVGFSINSKGYIGMGTGTVSPNIYNDLYEYDPTANIWLQKASCPGPGKDFASAFSIGNSGYIGLGGSSSNSFTNDLWEYNQINNNWTQRATFNGLGRRYAAGFSLLGKGYVAGGYSYSLTIMNDLWQYDPINSFIWSNSATSQSVSITGSSPQSVTVTNFGGCAGTSVQNLSLSPNPSISVTSPSLICTGNTYTIFVGGANTYTWSANAGSGNSTSVIITPTGNVNFTVSGTNGSCTVGFPIPLNVYPSPSNAMAISGPTPACGALTLSPGSPGNNWTQKTVLPALGRRYPVVFGIGSKAYTGTGYNTAVSQNYLNDFWEYDPFTNAWTQKANFGGTARSGAVGFSIGNKGYVGTGSDASTGYRNDFWEYNPISNSWSQKSNFGGTARELGVGFSIGTKGYIGTGFNTNQGPFFNDFWEYDPMLDSWTQKTSFPGASRYGAIGFNINSKGYIGTGGSSVLYTDFWEYDPNTNSWTAKSNVGGLGRINAAGFSISAKGFIGMGQDIMANSLSDFWEYDQSSNVWTQRSNFIGTGRRTSSGFALAGRGYIFAGYSNSFPYYLNDLWQYDPIPSLVWSTGSTLQAIPVNTSGNYSFTITNNSGCFATAAQSITIFPNPTISVSNPSIICSGNNYSLMANGANTYTWSANVGGGNSTSVMITPTSNITYTVSGTTGSCTVSLPVSLNVNQTPTATIAVSGPTLGCGTLMLSNNSTGNTWSQRASMSIGRQFAVAFSIGNKGYTGTGISNNTSPFIFNDFWEYDPSNNAWTQKANFAGGQRTQAVGFNIGIKGYVGTGIDNSNNHKNDFWEYDPIANTWTQKANFAGSARYFAIGFGIGTKGYLGTGSGTVSPNTYNDFWEYDPPTNTWTQKASFVGTSRYGAVGFSILNKGYVCTGSNNGTSGTFNDTWEYDATLNSWTQKAAFSGNARFAASAFVISNRAFIGTGLDNTGNYSNDFWEYNQSNNTWTQRLNFVGSARQAAVAFAIGGKGYLGTGYSNTSPNFMSDLWEYNPINLFNWSTGSTLQSLPLSNSGNYSLTVTSVLGCSSSAVQSISLSPNPTISVTTPSLTCSGSSLSLIANGANTYTWSANAGSSNSSSIIVSPTSSVIYTVSGSNTNCSSAVQVTLTVYPLPTLTINASTLSVCHGNTVILTANGATSYTWSGGISNNLAFAPNTSTSYSVIGASSVGCFNSQPVSITVTVNPSPLISVNSGTICQGQTFTMSPGGANTYTYSSGTSTVAPLINNTYSVIGTSSFGCVSASAAIASVVVLSSPTVVVSNGSICAGQSFTLTPTGANNYVYSGGNSVVTPGNSSSYTITGTNANGCNNFIPAVAAITVYTLPIISAASGSICNGSSYTINPNGANTYTYSSGSNVISPTSNTSYSIFGTNSAGCINAVPAVLNVTVNPIPVLTVNSGTICQGQSFTMNPSGASTYTYSSGSSVVSPIFNNNYSVIGTSSAGCVSAAAAISTINVLTSPTLAVSGGSICNGQSFTLSPTGAVTYTYSGGSSVVSPNTNTTYTITGTNANGCNNFIPAVTAIAVYTLPIISAASGSICNGSSFTINPTGANTYTYSSGSNVVSPTSNTSYSIFGTNAAGCVNTIPALISVTVNSTPLITVNSGTMCQGQNFTLSPTGASTYSYLGGSAIISPTTNTSYSVIGTSSAGCISSIAAISNVTVFALPIVSVIGGSICAGNSFTLAPSGANTYTYSGGSSVVNPNSTNSYSISGSNTLGCVSASPAVAIVTVYTLPLLSVNSGSICSGNSFTINASGASSYTYSSVSNIVSPISNTSYSITGTNSNGCVGAIPAISQVTVVANPTISVPSSVTICIGDAYTITPSGAANYTYSGGTNIVSPSTSTNYSLIGASAQGCINSAVISVSVQPALTLSINGPTLSCEGQTLALTANGANSYTWSNGATGSVIIVTPITNTVYGFSAVDGYCTGNALQTLSINANPTVNILSTNSIICESESATLTAIGANTYTWDNGNNTQSIIIQPTITTSYSVIGIDQNGCTNTSMITQMVDACVGVKNLIKNDLKSIQVYPNPNHGLVIVEISTENSNAIFEIYNYLGQLILKEDAFQLKTQLNFNFAANGVYTLRVLDGNKTMYITKIIKQ